MKPSTEPRRWEWIVVAGLLTAAGVASLALMAWVPFSGDDSHYVTVTRRLAALISEGNAFSVRRLQRAAVLQGWFMPGVSLLMLPAALLAGGEVPPIVSRLICLLINIALVGLIWRELRYRYSSKTAFLFGMLLFACPYYIFNLSGVLSEILAIHCAILICLWIDRQTMSGGPSRPVATGIAVAALTWVRALYPALIALWSANWLLRALRQGEPLTKVLPPWFGRSTIALGVFLVLLLPWSALISDRYGFTLTIVSAPVSQIVLFDDGSYLAAARQETGLKGRWRAMHQHISERAEAAGLTFLAQARRDRDSVLARTPIPIAAARIAQNMRLFLLDQNSYLEYFLSESCRVGHCAPGWLEAGLAVMNQYGWMLLLIAGSVVFCVPMTDRNGSYFMPLLWKGLVFLLALHPVIVTASGRHHAQFVPLFALGIAMVATGNWQVYRFRRDLALHDGLIGAGQALAAVMAVGYALLMAFG